MAFLLCRAGKLVKAEINQGRLVANNWVCITKGDKKLSECPG